MEDPTQVLPARVAKHVTVRPSEPRGPAVGRQGRSSTYYKQVAAEYAKGQYPCHLCGIRPGVWTDHVPPLADFPHHSLWRGKLMPSCQPCQSRQGARITNERRGTARPTSRAW